MRAGAAKKEYSSLRRVIPTAFIFIFAYRLENGKNPDVPNRAYTHTPRTFQPPRHPHPSNGGTPRRITLS
jgi:hypothetical protein